MRTIERDGVQTRLQKGVKADLRHASSIDVLLIDVLALLAADQPLPEKNRDHALSGEWKGYRDCHLKPDLLLVYAKPDAETLRLVRLGSHSELFN